MSFCFDCFNLSSHVRHSGKAGYNTASTKLMYKLVRVNLMISLCDVVAALRCKGDICCRQCVGVAARRNAGGFKCKATACSTHVWPRLGAQLAFSSAAAPQESTEKSCWFCGDCTNTAQQFSCDNCGYLQPPNTKIDYFTQFGMCAIFPFAAMPFVM